MAAAASAGSGCDQGDLPAGRASGDDGADLDRDRDLGRGSRRVCAVGIRPGERGRGAEGRQGGGQAAQDGGDTKDVTDAVHHDLLQCGFWPARRNGAGERVAGPGGHGTWPDFPWAGPFGVRCAPVAGGQLPGGPGAGCGTTMGVPVRWPAGAGARPRQTAMRINAAVTASTRATPTVIGAGSRRCCGLAGRLTGTLMVAAMIAASRRVLLFSVRAVRRRRPAAGRTRRSRSRRCPAR